MKKFLPLMLDMAGKKVVIFGAGAVGERKATHFLDFADITVISRDFTLALEKLFEERKIKIIKVKNLTDNEISEHVKNAFIVIPATNDTLLNENIALIAQKSGKLVNRVDDMGDIIVPSVIRRGDIMLGISTLGNSPALSKYIRKKLEEVISPEFEQMARIQKEMRDKLKSQVKDQKQRSNILWNIINDDDVWEALGESYEKAFKVASEHIDR
jgi:precorrin-2 dehydrogenase/sirohydrochlorin ferrochelatase